MSFQLISQDFTFLFTKLGRVNTVTHSVSTHFQKPTGENKRKELTSKIRPEEVSSGREAALNSEESAAVEDLGGTTSSSSSSSPISEEKSRRSSMKAKEDSISVSVFV